MSLYDRGEPAANEQFRRNTAKVSMLNVRQVPKMCKCVRCERLRTKATGKDTDAGFVCGMCGGRK